MCCEASDELGSTPGQRVTFTSTQDKYVNACESIGDSDVCPEDFNKNHNILEFHKTLEASGTMAKLIDELTVSELKQELGKYMLRKTGQKEELRHRLEQFLAHKKTINSFLYTNQVTDTKDETSPSKRRKLQIDNDVVPSSQPESGRLVVTPRRPRVTPLVSPSFQKPNGSTHAAELGSEAVSSDSDDENNQTQEKDSVQEGDTFAMDEEEFAELVNRIATNPVTYRPQLTPRVSPYSPKPNSLTDPAEARFDAAASSVSDEDAKAEAHPATFDSSSAEMDALRQGGIHWVMSFYDPRERCWVKRLDSL